MIEKLAGRVAELDARRVRELERQAGKDSIRDGDSAGQAWADAMATTLPEAHDAAHTARQAGQAALAPPSWPGYVTTTWVRWPAARSTTTPTQPARRRPLGP